MKPVTEIARMLLSAREGIVKAGEAILAARPDPLSPIGRDYIGGVMESLAWVLDVDLHQMDDPKGLPAEVEPPTEVMVSRVDAYDCWLVEFPPDDTQAQQQYRSEFLSQKQAVELLDALRDSVLRRALLTPDEWRDRTDRFGRDRGLHAVRTAEGEGDRDGAAS